MQIMQCRSKIRCDSAGGKNTLHKAQHTTSEYRVVDNVQKNIHASQLDREIRSYRNDLCVGVGVCVDR